MDDRGLAGFLRNRRERVRPVDVGLPTGRRRRTPGLRREEVAQLAFISVEYYTQLEQARGPHPSREVVGSLASALRLTDVERNHLYDLAEIPRRPPKVPHDVPARVEHLLARLPHAAAFVLSADLEVLACNQLATAMMGDVATLPPHARNLARRFFLETSAQDALDAWELADPAAFARTVAADLRRARAWYPEDRELTSLIGDLRAGSAEFAELWVAGDLDELAASRKSFHHRSAGLITVSCDSLDISERDQRVLIYTPDPGSPSEEALRRMAESTARQVQG